MTQKLGVTYLLSNSDQLTYWLMKMGLFVLKYFSAFVVGVTVGYFVSPDEYLNWGIGAILIILGLSLVSKLYRLIARFFTRSFIPSFNEQKALFVKMSKIYSLIGAEVIHPSRLESDLLEVSKKTVAILAIPAALRHVKLHEVFQRNQRV